jgi:cysteine desulfurase
MNQKLPGITSVTLFGINNELMIKSLADKLAISTGSACSSAKPSHVLKAMGLTKEEIRNTVRISYGKFTLKQDIVRAVELMSEIYRKFKSIY